VEGQVAIGTASGRVESVWLEPGRPAAVPAAVRAVRQADLVLLGPGSTFTSVVPNLLVPELADALTDASRLVYICNLEAQPGETTGFPPEGHLAAILDHCPGLPVAAVLCQRPRDAAGAARELRAFAELGAAVVHAEVAADDHPGRHDAARLATALKELA
ncbi:MAG: gluconeogenesis factor YvcK family protein, partial [Actinomycetota bacterium]